MKLVAISSPFLTSHFSYILVEYGWGCVFIIFIIYVTIEEALHRCFNFILEGEFGSDDVIDCLEIPI